MAPFWLDSFRFAAPFYKNSNCNIGKWVDQSGIIQLPAKYPVVHLLISFWNIKHGIYVAILGLFSRYIVSRGDLRKEGRIAEIIPVDWAASEQLKRNRLLAAEGSARNVFLVKNIIIERIQHFCQKCPIPRRRKNARKSTQTAQRWILLRKPIFLHTPKNGPARESRDTLSLDSIISARSPKKAIFLHIIAIYLHGSQKKVISMHNRIWNSPNLHNITYFNVLPTFSWFKGSFELPYSNTYHWIHMSVLRVTVPDQYFCTKHLIWI